ncbi:MAG: hypothetical protein MSIBF_02235 [Candidatus Altiarchaeales archaeon IMC4]|nr:MAG: hypothetical protein MSIBF_02235 [Candidatus Altiarchaeales archaeon IMC4]
MRLFVFEYATSQGTAGSSILMEGYSMLKTAVNGLKKEGHCVETCLNQNVSEIRTLNPDKLHKVDSCKGALQLIADLKNSFDFVYPIAPEDELCGIVRFLESNGIRHLSSSPEAVAAAGDKRVAAEVFKDNAVKTPGNCRGFPCVAKPVFGAGCEGTYIIGSEDELDALPKNEKFIVQEYIEGDNPSVTFAVGKKGAFPLALNKQEIEANGGRLRYKGGMTPASHAKKDEIIGAAKKAVDCLPGLFGVVGVDLIAGDETYVIEVNPRMVTSFVGLAQVSNVSVLEAITGIPPKSIRFNSCAYFGHIYCPKDIEFNETIIKKISAMEGVWVPPVFGSAKAGESIAFAVSNGKSEAEAKDRFERLNKKIWRLI